MPGLIRSPLIHTPPGRVTALAVRDTMGREDPWRIVDCARQMKRISSNRLPEIMVLLGAGSLTEDSSKEIASLAAPEVLRSDLPLLAPVGALIGRWGFSFPLWRFLAQGFGGGSLLERWGMARLARPNDRDEAGRDSLGTGFVWGEGKIYVEYRRSYLVVANRARASSAALVIRNNSSFFGRDALPELAYVTTEEVDDRTLQSLDADSLSKGIAGFTPWPFSIPGMPQEETMHRITALLEFLDHFDIALSKWLFGRGAQGGRHLRAFLNWKLSTTPKNQLPWIVGLQDGTPPWFPHSAAKIDRLVLSDLERHIETLMRPPEGKDFYKIAILSGANGDLPA